MSESRNPSRSRPARAADSGPGLLGLGIRILLPLLLLGAGGIGYVILSKKQPVSAPPRPERKPIETRVLELKREDYQIKVRTQGAIRAHNQVSLTAQVSGRVKTIHPEFEEGAFFEEGDILLELDPVDFEVALVTAEAQLAQAKLSLAQEKIRATQARLDWEDLGYEEEPSPLVLREPQVALAEKQVELAKNQKLSAERNLERARVKAPFDGRVLTRSVGIGQTVGGAVGLGEIFATDYSEVRLPVSTRFLSDLSLPEDLEDPAVPIQLRDGLVEESEAAWEAKILRTEGALDSDTLELFAIARIVDPFGRDAEKVPLRVGQPVATEIPGRILEDVFVIPREAVSGLSRIRVVDPESLTLGTAWVTPVWSDEENLVFRDANLPDGTLLVVTRLVYAPDGGKVVIVEDAPPGDPAEATTQAPVGSGGEGAATK